MLARAGTNESRPRARTAAVGTVLVFGNDWMSVGARLHLDIAGGFRGRWFCGRLDNLVGECVHRQTFLGQTSWSRLQRCTDLIEPLDALCRSTTQQAHGESDGHHD